MNIFHILNRGVEKRKLFLNESDYLRFVHNLIDFNNEGLAVESYKNRREFEENYLIRRKKLVEIIAWCLMPNHFHILVKENVEGGAWKFSKKITSGYTQSFNLKRNRSGVLFQGKTKIVPVVKDQHFLYIPYYIFVNPIKLKQFNWKDVGIKQPKEMFKFIGDYKWSSLKNVFGEDTFPEVVNEKLFFKLFDTTEEEFKNEIKKWINTSAIGKPKRINTSAIGKPKRKAEAESRSNRLGKKGIHL